MESPDRFYRKKVAQPQPTALEHAGNHQIRTGTSQQVHGIARLGRGPGKRLEKDRNLRAQVCRNPSARYTTDISTGLMRKAFDKTTGPLTELSQPEAQRDSLAHLFAGAIGSYKNPHSHHTDCRSSRGSGNGDTRVAPFAHRRCMQSTACRHHKKAARPCTASGIKDSSERRRRPFWRRLQTLEVLRHIEAGPRCKGVSNAAHRALAVH
jgi:hypothetical protein